LDVILVDIGVLRHVWGVIRREKTNLNLQSITLLKYVSKKTKKYLRRMNIEFKRVVNHFLIQFAILKKIKQGSQDPNLVSNFIKEYDSEVKSIKKFYRTGINDLLMRLINKINPKQAVILWGLTNLPASAQIAPISALYFSIQYALILGIFSEIIKWCLVGGYSLYLYKKSSN